MLDVSGRSTFFKLVTPVPTFASAEERSRLDVSNTFQFRKYSRDIRDDDFWRQWDVDLRMRSFISLRSGGVGGKLK
jgi:hypothetical protein